MPLYVPYRMSRTLFFNSVNQAANASGVVLSLPGQVAVLTGWWATRPGKIMEIFMTGNAIITAGVGTFTAFIDAGATSLVVTANSTTAAASPWHLEASDLAGISYAAGARLTLRITTDANWAPTTIDLVGGIFAVDD